MAVELQGKQQFAEAVKLYVEVVDEIARLTKRASQLRKHKTAMSDQLLKAMEELEEDGVSLERYGGGKLLRHKSKRVEGVKKEVLMEELGGLLGDSNRAEELIAQVWNNRPVVEKWTLKRTRPRGSSAAEAMGDSKE